MKTAIKTVIINGKKCKLKFGMYNNNTLALQAFTLDGELYMTCSVNWEANWEGAILYKDAFQFPGNSVIIIKNYSENEGVVKCLADAGVITPGAYLSGTNGTVEACTLTKEWFDIAKTQLKL